MSNVRTNDVSVSLYEVDGELRVIAQFSIAGLLLDKNQHGLVDLRKREILQRALEEALSNWNFNV